MANLVAVRVQKLPLIPDSLIGRTCALGAQYPRPSRGWGTIYKVEVQGPLAGVTNGRLGLRRRSWIV